MRSNVAYVAVLLLASCREPAREWPAGELRSGGRPVVETLAAGDFHRYRLPLQKDSLLRLIVDQQGIDAVVTLEDPAGAPVLTADRLTNDRGPELVLAVADRSGDYRLVVRGFKSGPGRYAAQVVALRPASAHDRLSAEAYQLFTGAVAQEAGEAMESWKRALTMWQQLGEVALEAEAHERIAGMYFDRGNSEAAAESYSAAAAAFARVGDRRGEAIVRTNLGSALLDLGEAQGAAEQYALALLRGQQEGDRLTEAKALHGLGQAFQNQGELQKALDRYKEALARWPQSDSMIPYTLHQLGVLYARYMHDGRKGADYLLQALMLWEPGRSKARTLNQLGRLSYEQHNLDEARQYSEEALKLLQESDSCTSAVVRARLALVEEGQGAPSAADARMAEALRIVGSTSCPKSAPTVHLLAAGLAEERRDPAAARVGYHRCETLFAELGDRMGMAESLAGIARSEHSLGDRQAARAASRRALDIFEGVRPTVLSEDLRTSFFSGVRPAFDFHIDLLREIGAEEEAWATAEEERARVLQDLLAESGAGLRRDAPSGLAEQERDLQRQLNALDFQRRAARDTQEDKRKSLQQKIDTCVAKLEALRGEIRRPSGRSTSPTHTQPVTLASTRRELLDGDTVLLEFHLGKKESVVWAVTRDTFIAASLPMRAEIERLAHEAASRMQSFEWQGRNDNPQVLCELSRTLLGPVAPALGLRRLVVVADGALEAIPFAALPVPVNSAACPAAPLLMESHEVVSLPSVAAFLTQRRLLAGRRPASGWLAVVADPSYSSYRRLPESAQEAKAITAGLPTDKVLVATGAAASRQTVITDDALRDFRIVHFAVHGVLNREQPLLSALVLAELDPAGRPVPGTGNLPAHEIYDLNLPAELVVLSACDTGLGTEVPGEGLVSGLPRAFLYAGAARVLVSLWPVKDQSTRELMVHFYRGLFKKSLPPARALQEAQRALRKAGSAPSQWAGFILLGDWRSLPHFSN